ncbi:MAG: hypothetical protein KKB81_07815 [Candidatus Margulisbacteria bacterium]|nr:hypothetical protein [Candidatus Margulisiibacteriota bacterium]MBU1022528.1 hypothetical protein [Candidatus Margulisiibacteriota bacterium]MBU1728396.1 hypothetical protein [Candidatus Margulisiibacteriota bacterium]MBU1955240.1 hypothetical protein [Candidatus Margulisiibacteriota bacterium]
MKNPGQNTYKGINAQAWAAMSLFLQYLRDPKFSYIHLEAPKFQDFNLVFEDGKKIICESKARKKKFSYENLKEVLTNLSKKGAVGETDDILIICNNINEKLERAVAHSLYFKEILNSFKAKGYSVALLGLLPRVKFWVIPQAFNKNVIYSLFAETINFWLPRKDVQNIVDSILIQKIYKGSAKGGTYSKNEIMQEIDDIKNNVIEDSGLYDKERVAIEKQYESIDAALDNPASVQWAIGQIKSLSANYDLLSFVIERKKKEQINNLELWDNIWQLYSLQIFSSSIFEILKKNIHTDNNKRYVVDFILKNIGVVKGFYRESFFIEQAVEIVTDIITANADNKYLMKAFEIAKKLIQLGKEEYFYVKSSQHHRDLYEKEKAVGLIKEIYYRADNYLKEEIAKFLLVEFNLVEDEGQFSHYSPPIVFEILRKWLDECFDDRFSVIVTELSEQYDRFYRKFGKKVRFKGWELMGGTTAYWGGNYQITDRHFINYILEPAVKRYYAAEQKTGWEFIKKYCINKKTKVSKSRPDFLNRSVYKIILDRYASDDLAISEEAFNILKAFIMFGEGIPNKAELIYQAAVASDMPDEKKWSLVAITFPKNDVPLSPFVERIVTNLAKRGMEKAKNELKKWLLNPKYYKRFMFELDSMPVISELLDSDLDLAIELFKSLLTSAHLSSDRKDPFGAYDVAALLHKILKKDYQKGLSIIRFLESLKTLSYAHQIIYSYSLFQHYGNDDSDDPALLMKAYQDVVDPLLNKYEHKNIDICQRLPKAICREAFVKFAARLAAKKEIEKALRIIQVFKNDPDPYLPGRDPDDPKDEFNEHKNIIDGKETNTITSVRGYCGWVLMKCSTLYGREHIPQIIELTDELIKDENWYVKQMASFALAQLARNRLTVLPDNRNVLFFGKDTEDALRNAKKVEAIAFNLLGSVAEASNNVKIALAKSILSVFGHIRALSMNDALCLANTVKNFPHEAIAEAAPLFIYFAEFRKDGFKEWKWALPGLYDDLGPEKYDDKKFKDILLETIDEIEPGKRFSFAAQFEHMIRTLSNNEKDAKNQFEIAFYYLNYLSKEYNHEVFGLIYAAIKEGLEKGQHIDELLKLYNECLKKERNFYNAHLKTNDVQKMYWWPSRYNEDILMFIYQKDKAMFLDVFSIITSFPKEFYIHDSTKIISLLGGFPKTNKKAKALVKQLFERNQSKYYDLRSAWFSKKQ